MKAIILAAGIGSRIRPLTDNSPKSLLQVAGKPIITRMLENIEAAGIKDVGIVTGYMEDTVKEFVTTNFPNLNFSFKRNDVYLDTNTGYSLMLAHELVGDDSFVKFDADVVFQKEILEKLLNSSHESALCIDKNIHLEAEEVKVITDENGNVLEVEKSVDPQKANGESIGIEKIGKETAKVLFAELEALMQDKNHWKEYYEYSYTTLVGRGVPFGAVDITGLKWVEIDTHEDYARANEMFK